MHHMRPINPFVIELYTLRPKVRLVVTRCCKVLMNRTFNRTFEHEFGASQALPPSIQTEANWLRGKTRIKWKIWQIEGAMIIAKERPRRSSRSCCGGEVSWLVLPFCIALALELNNLYEPVHNASVRRALTVSTLVDALTAYAQRRQVASSKSE